LPTAESLKSSIAALAGSKPAAVEAAIGEAPMKSRMITRCPTQNYGPSDSVVETMLYRSGNGNVQALFCDGSLVQASLIH
jgi:hypothetical protein